jgi:hypothetical protein
MMTTMAGAPSRGLALAQIVAWAFNRPSRSSMLRAVKKPLVDKGHGGRSQGRHDDDADRDADANRDDLPDIVFHDATLEIDVTMLSRNYARHRAGR